MSHDVFISYSSKDKTIADAVCAALEGRRIRCWVAPRDILPSMDWGEAIIDAITGATVMVLVFSGNSNGSNQVKREVQNAASQGLAILPLRVEDIEPTKAMQYFLGTHHWLDALSPPFERHLDTLCDNVDTLLTRLRPERAETPREVAPSTPVEAAQVPPPTQQQNVSLQERLQRLREARERKRAEAEEAERRRCEEESATLRALLAEQLDHDAFDDARNTVTAMLKLSPDDAEAKEAQALILQELAGAAGGGGCEAVGIPGTDAIIEMVWCPPGTFMMGSPPAEAGRQPKETQHEVTLTKGFWLGKYAVTQAQWQAVLGNNPSNFKGDDQNPVEMVSWDDSQGFIQKLNATGEGGFRLPTEAEWEYACRAGSTTAYCFGDDAARLGEYAWYADDSAQTTHPVGQKKPNAWGLCDMHGNVVEWCDGWFGGYPNGSVSDPAGAASGQFRVLRGGAWERRAENCRSAVRYVGCSGEQYNWIGFRFARTP